MRPQSLANDTKVFGLFGSFLKFFRAINRELLLNLWMKVSEKGLNSHLPTKDQ